VQFVYDLEQDAYGFAVEVADGKNAPIRYIEPPPYLTRDNSAANEEIMTYICDVQAIIIHPSLSPFPVAVALPFTFIFTFPIFAIQASFRSLSS